MSFGLSPEEKRALILSVGVRGERPLNPTEVARLFNKMIENGAKRADCAAAVHFERPDMVGRFLKLLELHPDVEVSVDWGASAATISPTAAKELARLPRDEHPALCRAAIENQMPTVEIQEVVRLRLQTHKTLDTCVQQVLQLRPRVERRYMFIGRIEDEQLTQSLESMPQPRRDALVSQALLSLDARLRETSAKLTRNRFSIVGGEVTAEALRGLKPDFESVITEAIRAALKGG